MSALGHKQTCAVQEAMSALPPIATAKADIGAQSKTRDRMAGWLIALYLTARIAGTNPINNADVEKSTP